VAGINLLTGKVHALVKERTAAVVAQLWPTTGPRAAPTAIYCPRSALLGRCAFHCHRRRHRVAETGTELKPFGCFPSRRTSFDRLDHAHPQIIRIPPRGRLAPEKSDPNAPRRSHLQTFGNPDSTLSECASKNDGHAVNQP
jgi:hypothetical protein